jgi:2-haloacid dehalogenase
MSSSPNLIPRALIFDVFGTCVNWRHSITHGLYSACLSTLGSSTRSIPPSVRTLAEKMTQAEWGQFAQQWRNSYKVFTKSFSGSEPNSGAFQTVDEHHYESLLQLLREWKLEDLWTEEELQQVNHLWHRLDPWPDSVLGMKCFNTKFETSTLSNGNLELLRDLKKHSGIEFTHLISSEMFGAYKPSPKTYLGACEKLALQPGECVMVAAHLDDLMYAKRNGLGTVYVERPLEEDFSDDEIEEVRRSGFVDLWVTGEEGGGFLTLAEKLGIDIGSVTGPV